MGGNRNEAKCGIRQKRTRRRRDEDAFAIRASLAAGSLFQKFDRALASSVRCFPETGRGKRFLADSTRQPGNWSPSGLLSLLYFAGPRPGVGRAIPKVRHPVG